MSISRSSRRLLRDREREKDDVNSSLVLGPAIEIVWSLTFGRSNEDRTLGVEAGESASGSGTDSERWLGGGMCGTVTLLGAGICNSSGFRSAFPRTSLIALKSKPACRGILVADPTSPCFVTGVGGIGICSGARGVESFESSRGGRSSSSALIDDDDLRC